jgi:hypothetical protein
VTARVLQERRFGRATAPPRPSPAGLHSTGLSEAKEQAEDMTAAAAGVACAADAFTRLHQAWGRCGRLKRRASILANSKPGFR